jgi:hypothetical protein
VRIPFPPFLVVAVTVVVVPTRFFGFGQVYNPFPFFASVAVDFLETQV